MREENGFYLLAMQCKGKEMNKEERQFINKYESLAMDRIKKSASGYVLVKRFGLKHRTGLKKARDEGRVTIIDTCFGRAYQLEKE